MHPIVNLYYNEIVIGRIGAETEVIAIRYYRISFYLCFDFQSLLISMFAFIVPLEDDFEHGKKFKNFLNIKYSYLGSIGKLQRMYHDL
jgi:hypothetical protein